MKKLFKNLFSDTDIYYHFCTLRFKLNLKSDLRKWERDGRKSSTPHLIKQRVIKAYLQKFQITTFVETGTYLGHMVDAMKNDFIKIYSIELNGRLSNWASKRFRHLDHIEIIQGDSGKILKKVVRDLEGPAIFWLDGHYSAGITARGEKDTPIREELDCILNSEEKGHIIIIDDAHLFGNDPNYPSIEELIIKVHSISPNADVTIEDDTLRGRATFRRKNECGSCE